MAVIRNIDVNWDALGTAHPTEVDANVKVISTFGDDPIIQIDTFGSDDRKLSGKVSQTVQLDRRSATQLVEILKKAFRL